MMEATAGITETVEPPIMENKYHWSALKSDCWKVSEKEYEVWFCLVVLNISFCPEKQELGKNKSQVPMVRIPQRKGTKCNTYNHSFSLP